ncbi:MAG: PAS domain S-box protein [Candidatus Omnitrophota bacterium]
MDHISEIYKKIIDFSGDGVCQYTVSEGRILYANQGLVRILNLDCTPEEMKGKLLTEVLPFTAELEQLKKDVNSREEIRDLAYQFRTLKGDHRWVIHNSFMLKDPDTGLEIVEAVIKDVTERARAEEALRQYHDHLEEMVRERTVQLESVNTRLQAEIVEHRRTEAALGATMDYLDKIINSVANPIFVKDRNHRWVLLNDAYCDFMGYAREELLGKSDYDFFPKAEAEVFWEKDEVVFSTGRENMNEEHFTDSKGALHIISTRKVLYRDKAGAEFIVGIIVDITENKRAGDEIRDLNEHLKGYVLQLEAANRELDSFTYSVSHDLKAPLRSIQGFSQILREECSGKLGAGEHALDVIGQSVRKMNTLIDGLLSFARLSGKELSRESVNMEALTREAFEEVRRVGADTRKVTLEIQALPVANADPVLIRQVLINMLANAVKFTCGREEARIEAGCKSSDREHIYYLRDNGVGFDNTYAGKLFGVFQRLHGEHEFEGTGVGLAIVQRIIKRHGGRVWGEGAPGVGATFYFSLPK